MFKKYILTFSLAAMSCIATKTIQNTMEAKEGEDKTKIVNLKKVNLQRQASIYTSPVKTYH